MRGVGVAVAMIMIKPELLAVVERDGEVQPQAFCVVGALTEEGGQSLAVGGVNVGVWLRRSCH